MDNILIKIISDETFLTILSGLSMTVDSLPIMTDYLQIFKYRQGATILIAHYLLVCCANQRSRYGSNH